MASSSPGRVSPARPSTRLLPSLWFFLLRGLRWGPLSSAGPCRRDSCARNPGGSRRSPGQLGGPGAGCPGCTEPGCRRHAHPSLQCPQLRGRDHPSTVEATHSSAGPRGPPWRRRDTQGWEERGGGQFQGEQRLRAHPSPPLSPLEPPDETISDRLSSEGPRRNRHLERAQEGRPQQSPHRVGDSGAPALPLLTFDQSFPRRPRGQDSSEVAQHRPLP